MRTSVSFLSLLLFALPAFSLPYHICGSDSYDCIVSTGRERPGDAVKTARLHPIETVLEVGAPIIDHNTEGFVRGKSGLFVGRSEDGKRLEWVIKPHAFKWEFSPGAQREFHVVREPGREKFWLDAGRDKPVKIVGPDVGDVYWSFKLARFEDD